MPQQDPYPQYRDGVIWEAKNIPPKPLSNKYDDDDDDDSWPCI